MGKLRGEGKLIIVSGMAVHNLRSMGYGTLGRVMEYTETFDEALKEVVEEHGTDEERAKAMVVLLLSRSDARRAHPTFERCYQFMWELEQQEPTKVRGYRS